LGSAALSEEPEERSVIPSENRPAEAACGGRFVHAYYGGGKGKTTAAIGLAVRAAGAGLKVAFLQFDKGWDRERGEHYAERAILRSIPGIELVVTGCGRIREDGTFRFGVEAADRLEAERALTESQALLSGGYDLVVLDEALAALAYGLVTEEELLGILEAHAAAGRPCELVLTGHKLPESIKSRADLVTHMRKVKHYFDNGVAARPGIEF
ncbi:cob(I)yrinic acid a,c-diamide adenosyltransferase, partial [Planctomycetota bacterium]